MYLFNEPFFNRRNWILENLESLQISLEEALVVLIIDYFNEFDKVVDIHSLSKKLNMEKSVIDQILNSLMMKGYLKLEIKNRKMVYQLDGLFFQKEDAKPASMESVRTLFELFEQEFKRPLSQRESEMISAWVVHHEYKLIEYALREAIIQDKINFNYIDRILANWKESGYTYQMYEEK